MCYTDWSNIKINRLFDFLIKLIKKFNFNLFSSSLNSDDLMLCRLRPP